jgi:hypothetical protein
MVHGVGLAGPGLDLNGNPGPVDRHNEIELSSTNARVAGDEPGPSGDEKAGGDILTKGTKRLASRIGGAQRAEEGSSSSILTSRNVITLTLLTNRAGRYMSHTHASFNSSSK